MITLLMVMIIVVALCTRQIPAVILASVILIQDIAATNLDGWLYYVSDGFSNLVVLAILCLLSRPSKLTTNIIYLSFCSLILNFYGWIMWICYLSPQSYDKGFLILYSVAIYIILRGEGERNCNCDSLPFNDRESLVVYKLVSEEAKN